MVQILPWREIAVNSRRSVTDLHFKGESMSRISTALVAVVLFGMAGIAGPTWADDLPVLGDKKALSDVAACGFEAFCQDEPRSKDGDGY